MKDVQNNSFSVEFAYHFVAKRFVRHSKHCDLKEQAIAALEGEGEAAMMAAVSSWAFLLVVKNCGSILCCLSENTKFHALYVK